MSWRAPSAPARAWRCRWSTWTGWPATTRRMAPPRPTACCGWRPSGLARGVRSYDCVCRLDEDEFALVLPGMTAESAAALVGGWPRRSRGRPASARSQSRAAWPRFPSTRPPSERAGAAGQRARCACARAGGGRIDGLGRAATEPPEAQRSQPTAVRSLESRAATSADVPRRQRVRRPHRRRDAGWSPTTVDRVRLAAYLYDATAPAGAAAERAQLAGAGGRQHDRQEAAGWLLARAAPVAEAPLEARVIAVAEAFVAAGGHRSGIAAGRALAGAVAACGRRAGRGLRARARTAAGRAQPATAAASPTLQLFLRRCVRWRAAIAASGRGVGVWPGHGRGGRAGSWSTRARPARR